MFQPSGGINSRFSLASSARPRKGNRTVVHLRHFRVNFNRERGLALPWVRVALLFGALATRKSCFSGPQVPRGCSHALLAERDIQVQLRHPEIPNSNDEQAGEVSGIALPKMEASGVSDAGNVERPVNPAAPIQLTPSHTEDPGEAAPSMGHALIGRRKYHLVPWSKNSISQTLGPVRWSSSKQRQDSSP
jgi:hypothetical protein